MIAIVLQKNLKPDRSRHTHRAELGSKPQVCAPTKPTAKSCFANTMDPQGRAQPHCPAGKCTGGVGKGPESGAPHPGSSAPPPSRSNPIHPQKHAPPHKPTPAHWPHRCSPTQTFKGTRGAHFMVCLALSCQTENRHRDVPCLSRLHCRRESRSLGLSLGICRLRARPRGRAVI